MEIIEPFPGWHWPTVYGWVEPVIQLVADDFAPKTIEGYVEYSSRAAEHGRVMGVAVNGQLRGVLIFEFQNPACAMMHVLFAPAMRGSKLKCEAARLGCARLFETTPAAIKIFGLIHAENRAAVALAKRGRGRVEGVLRSHSVSGGKPFDVTVVGITREEFFNATAQLGDRDRRIGGGNVGNDGGDHIGNDSEQQHADLQRGADGASIDADQLVPKPGAIAGERDTLAIDAGDGDGRRESDQHDLGGAGKPHDEVSGKPRVRKQRNDGRGSVADRVGKGKPARGQRKRGGGKPAHTK
jgi:RimJ/RimL family protein N-acetyltransferase